ncbi:ferrous iron transport protein B [Planctomicrobium sp. SH661]|uniref:ferrous iron transport protein B n=1 Tax=Planctomicrobium sp. SH661 TaxID=3448124 RepID=UPI003F5CAD68
MLTVALIGNPNTGKSTLFNALTGGKARIGNFPGVTVEKKVGRFEHAGRQVRLVDLPGTYSLSPRSADEMVSVDVLLGRQKEIGRPDAVVCITDASNLERNLYLFSQIRDLQIPVLLVLNMWDVAQQSGVKIDVQQLRERLGVNIITTSAHRREGIDALRAAVVETATHQANVVRLFPADFYAEVEKLGDWLKQHGVEETPEFLRERVLLDVHGEAEHRAAMRLGDGFPEMLAAARTRLAQAGCKVPLVETKVRYDWIRRQLSGVVERTQSAAAETASDRIDRWLTHRFTGLLIFIALMFVIFQSIYTWAGPAMDLVEAGQGAISDWIMSILPPGTLRSLLVDGIVAGVGSVIIFLPQIVLLFTFVAILEDCGYMARAAFLMDKLMTKVGLSGKSFLPLMSSFACAIPGVMATRVIENRKDRMVTMLVAPLMSCSARLPVYVLMVAAFIPATTWAGGLIGLQGMVLFLMQALGALVAIPVAWILKKTFFKGETPPFVMELPAYKWPSVRMVFDRVYERAKAFVTEAGTLIFAVSILIWAAGYFPGDHTEQQKVQAEIERVSATLADEESSPELDALHEREQEISSQLVRDSYLGRFGRAVEPVFLPLGWDWRIGVGAIASFPAREVIIATMGTIFSLGGDVSEDDSTLQATLQSATWPNGEPLFTIPVALSIMVFFALCAQCGATLMVIRRETNTWRWPAFTFAYMTLLAYVAALATYQIGTAVMGG